MVELGTFNWQNNIRIQSETIGFFFFSFQVLLSLTVSFGSGNTAS